MEMNPVYAFAQHNPETLDENEHTCSNDANENIYVDFNSPETCKNSSRRRMMEDSVRTTGNTQVATASQPKVENTKRGVNIVFGISILGLLVLAVTAILVSVLMASNYNKDIQLLQEELENVRVMLNQTGEDSNYETQSLREELRVMVNKTEEHSNNEIQSLQEKLENLRVILNQTGQDSNYEIQFLRDELMQMLNQTGQHSNNEIQSLQLETASLRKYLNQTKEHFSLQVSSLRTDSQAQYDVVMDIIDMLTQRGSIINPARSCVEIPSDHLPGDYWILDNNSQTPAKVFCDAIRRCGDNTTEWTRVAYVNMTELNQQCPGEFRLVTRNTAPLQTCGRIDSSCTSATFPVNGKEYSYVYGQIKAYQYGGPDGFYPYFINRALTIDNGYVNGISLTHGRTPRQHIWTFVAVPNERAPSRIACPCTRPDSPFEGVIPPFIGQDYFCETGRRESAQPITLYTEDPLWDGQGCGVTSTCCSFNNPPWFCKQLLEPTTDDIELRLCFDQASHDEDIQIELIEIYIQ